jgi:hypothetical protein
MLLHNLWNGWVGPRGPYLYYIFCCGLCSGGFVVRDFRHTRHVVDRCVGGSRHRCDTDGNVHCWSSVSSTGFLLHITGRWSGPGDHWLWCSRYFCNSRVSFLTSLTITCLDDSQRPGESILSESPSALKPLLLGSNKSISHWHQHTRDLRHSKKEPLLVSSWISLSLSQACLLCNSGINPTP